MEKVLFVDVDGVLRNLNEIAFGFEPSTWNYKNEKGENLIDILKQHPEYNLKAKPYPYLNVINKLPEVNILTASYFRKETEQWLNTFLKIPFKIHFVSFTKQKIQFLKERKINFNENLYLIDDSPELDSIKNLILINRNYNQNILPFVRIFNEKELENVLNNLGFLK